MKIFARLCLSLIVVAAVIISSFAQETFRNPAMEEDTEFSRAFARARSLARDGKSEEAIREFKKAASLKNNQCAECFHSIGQVYLENARYKDAVIAFRQALETKSEKEAEINNALGVALYQQNNPRLFEEAASAFRRAIELGGNLMATARYNLGRALIRAGREEEGVAELKKYLELAPTGTEASQARVIIANPRLASETLAIEFRARSIAGDELSLERFKGKVVLLDFWATWCKPCMFEMPDIKKLWRKYSADQFIVIGISLDRSEDALRSYIEKEGIEWPQCLDSSGKIAGLYNARSIPYTVLIDHEGIVRAVGIRGGALSGKVGDLLKKIPKANR
ncbi:MAG: redoxin domain-containing protein [Acidobacteriota bacterium]